MNSVNVSLFYLSNLCVFRVVDREFRYNIVKVTVDPQITMTML